MTRIKTSWTRIRLAFTFCFVIWVLMLPTVSRADDAADVKAAAHDFAEAITKGDANAAKANSISSETADRMIDTIARTVGSFKKLEHAAVTKFGNAGKALAYKSPGNQWDGQLDGAVVKFSGDTAAVTTKDKPEPLTMKKQNGRWKVDLTRQLAHLDAETLKQYFDTMSATGKIADEAATEIDAGKYQSVQEVQDAIVEKVRADLNVTATTRPAAAAK